MTIGNVREKKTVGPAERNTAPVGAGSCATFSGHRLNGPARRTRSAVIDCRRKNDRGRRYHPRWVPMARTVDSCRDARGTRVCGASDLRAKIGRGRYAALRLASAAVTLPARYTVVRTPPRRRSSRDPPLHRRSAPVNARTHTYYILLFVCTMYVRINSYTNVFSESLQGE